MRRVAVNGVSLAVHEWPGKGPAVICIHGLTANHTCWASIADILSPDYRLIAYAFLLIVVMILRPKGLLGTREG
jgi:pimeloyl-ACP methyl ester carboxylesterase